MDIDISTTQSPLTVNYNRVPQYFPGENKNYSNWYRRSENDDEHSFQPRREDGSRVGGRQQKSRISVASSRFNPKRRSGSHYSQGRRRQSRPLRVIKRRLTPPGIMTRVGDVGGQVKEWLLDKKRCFEGHQVISEAPVSLRAVTFIAGLAMTATSILRVFYIHEIVSNPAAYVLQVYQTLFGIATVTIEAKNLSMFDSLRDWVADWFPFLSTSLGKGSLYIFMGVLGVALWNDNPAAAVAGSFMIFLGLIYILIHFGLKKHLRHVGLELTQATARHTQHETQHEGSTEQGQWNDNNFHNNNDNHHRQQFRYPIEYVTGVNQVQRERTFDQSIGDIDNNTTVRFDLPSFYHSNDTDEQPVPKHYQYRNLATPLQDHSRDASYKFQFETRDFQ